MKNTTLHEAQQYKKLRTDTITEALNAFTTRTGLRVDSVGITAASARYGQACVYDIGTRDYVEVVDVGYYEVTVNVPM